MRILITNDDGIHAPGLAVLERIAQDIAGPDGSVWTVAPATEQSGVGHCISYSRPALFTPLGPQRFTLEGNPADCVIAALYEVMADARPDLVLSGVNRGNNAAENTLYSGTIGAAMEAALQNVPAIALSQYFGPDNAALDDPFEAAAQHGAACVRTLWSQAQWGGDGYQLFYNVNFPPVPAAAVKGTRMVRQGLRPDTHFRATAQTAPNRRRYIWVHGSPQNVGSGADTDGQANLDGYISVTPMRADLTDHAALDAMQDLFA